MLWNIRLFVLALISQPLQVLSSAGDAAQQGLDPENPAGLVHVRKTDLGTIAWPMTGPDIDPHVKKGERYSTPKGYPNIRAPQKFEHPLNWSTWLPTQLDLLKKAIFFYEKICGAGRSRGQQDPH